jgi:hypothetical protein
MRVADVLDIEGSGVSSELYSYALKSHFDFTVVNDAHEPLFAVEFDGPHHQGEAAAKADRKKNAVCEAMGFPLARVRDEHLFRKARGIDYLTWLAEVFFAYQALVRAQDSGQFPEDEPLDPMMFMSMPNLPGRFPLFISARARGKLQRLYEEGVVTSAVPDHFRGYDFDGTAAALNAVVTSDGGIILNTSTIYLSRFGVPASEAAEEIGTVKLVSMVDEHRRSGGYAVDALVARERLMDFVRRYDPGAFGGSGSLPFPVKFNSGQQGENWVFGSFNGAPESLIQKRSRR